MNLEIPIWKKLNKTIDETKIPGDHIETYPASTHHPFCALSHHFNGNGVYGLRAATGSKSL